MASHIYFRTLERLNVLIVLQAFWQILLLKKSPETIPYSPLLLTTALMLHLLVGIGGGLINLAGDVALIQAALGTLLLVGFTYLLMMFHGLGNRLVQTMTALAGCEFLIGLMGLPLSVWIVSVDKANLALPVMLTLLLLGWYVAVFAHIWRHALEVSKWRGFLFAIGYVIISITLTSLVQAPEG